MKRSLSSRRSSVAFSAERLSWLKERKRIARCSAGVRADALGADARGVRDDGARVEDVDDVDDGGHEEDVEVEDGREQVEPEVAQPIGDPGGFAPRSGAHLSPGQVRLIDGDDGLLLSSALIRHASPAVTLVAVVRDAEVARVEAVVTADSGVGAQWGTPSSTPARLAERAHEPLLGRVTTL